MNTETSSYKQVKDPKALILNRLLKANAALLTFDDAFFNAATMVGAFDNNFLSQEMVKIQKWRNLSTALHQAVTELKYEVEVRVK